MSQGDMERLLFLSLCGKRDRAILMGKENMTFPDLERLMYITDFLGLDCYNIEICNQYAGQFEEHFWQLEALDEETLDIVSWDQTEVDEEQRDRWIEDFFSQIPDKDIKKCLEHIFIRSTPILTLSGWQTRH